METTPAHQSILNKLRADTKEHDLSAHPARTLAAMDARYSFSSTRVALNALRKAYPACKEFETQAAERRDKWRSIDTAQEPTEVQKKKYMSWERLQEFRDENEYKMTDEEYFVMCLYTMWEPARADYTPMKIIKRKPRKLEEGMNYLVLGKRNVDVIFHAYKTAGTYGDVTRRMPADLAAVTREWIADHPGDYLLQDSNGVPYQPQRLGQIVRRVFQRLNSSDTGISSIRHAYATHVYKSMPSLQSLNQTSRNMMHGILTGQAYRFISLE
jgi:hypothetical protein